VDGSDAASVFTLNSPTVPEPGALGQCGGGSGGVGSVLTSEVTPRGGSGEGAFGSAAGGGGGRFGHDQSFTQSSVLCLDQSIYGLDVESGFPGHDNAFSSQGNHIPFGGHGGGSPFGKTPILRDDFFGRALLDFQTPGLRVQI
jgi:hypothetical protein